MKKQAAKEVNDADDPVFEVVEVNPQFPGGIEAIQKFLAENIRYPLVAQQNGIQGLVKASYSVNDNGEVSNVKIVEGVDPSLEKEVIRVIESLPAGAALKREGGKATPETTLSVLFRLQGEGVSTIAPVESDIVVVGYGAPQ